MGYLQEKYDRTYFLREDKDGTPTAFGADGVELFRSGKCQLRRYEQNIASRIRFANLSVLEFGYGRGEMLRYVREQGAGQVAGVDFSADAHQIAGEYLARHGLTAELYCDDALAFARRLGQEERRFDVVVMFEFVEHVPRQELRELLRELRPLLREKALLAINTPLYPVDNDVLAEGPKAEAMDTSDLYVETLGMHCNRYTLESLKQFLAETGYVPVAGSGHLFTPAGGPPLPTWEAAVAAGYPLTATGQEELYERIEPLAGAGQYHPQWYTITAGPLQGRSFFLDPKDQYWQKDILEGTYDRFFFQFLEHCELRGATVLDIGAHIGYHTLYFAHLVGASGRVFAFEPNPFNFERMNLILGHNADLAQRVTTAKAAIADAEGEIAFTFSPRIDSGSSSGSYIAGANTPEPEDSYRRQGFSKTQVAAWTLDTLDQHVALPAAGPVFVKIDIEGAEFLALSGGRGFVAKYRPTFLIELHSIFCQLQVLAFFQECGYSVRFLEDKAENRAFIAAVPATATAEAGAAATRPVVERALAAIARRDDSLYARERELAFASADRLAALTANDRLLVERNNRSYAWVRHLFPGLLAEPFAPLDKGFATRRHPADPGSAPKVSIIIPVYNGTNYLRAAIDSALAQTYQNREIIVINDGSTDDGATEALARSYGDRIRYYAKPNGGVASALNLGIEVMSGEYVSWLSHDDVYPPDKLARQIAFLQTLENREVVLYGRFGNIDAHDQRLGQNPLVTMPPGTARFHLYACPHMHGCTTLVPRSIFERVGRFDERLRSTQDYDLWLRVSEHFDFVGMDEELVLSRMHDEQGSRVGTHLDAVDQLYRRYLLALTRPRLEAMLGGKALHHYHALILRHCANRNHRMAAFTLLYGMDQAANAKERFWLLRHSVPTILKVRLKTRLAKLRDRWVGGPPPPPAVPPSRLDFVDVYRRNIFGSDESLSGRGSSLAQTEVIRGELPDLIRELQIRSILDIPCGDFNWMQHVDLSGVEYLGADLVEELIARNQERYGAPGRSFRRLNLVTDALPPCDLAICRDCLVHLPFSDALRGLANIKKSGAKWLLVSTFTARTENPELRGIWRALNMQLPPFSFPAPRKLIVENCPEVGQGGVGFTDKALGLWRVADLPDYR